MSANPVVIEFDDGWDAQIKTKVTFSHGGGEEGWISMSRSVDGGPAEVPWDLSDFSTIIPVSIVLAAVSVHS